MKVRAYVLFLLLLLTVVGGVVLYCNRRLSFEDVFGLNFSPYCRDVSYVYERYPDLKLVKAWAEIEVSEKKSQEICERSGLFKMDYGYLMAIPAPKNPPQWWQYMHAHNNGHVSKWSLANGNLRPIMIYAFWSDGKLYIYKHGIAP